MRLAATALYLTVAVVNLLPAIGALSTTRLATLYGVAVEDPNLAILLRHRAVLFAIVGGLLALAALHPPLRPVAIVAGLVSMLSFVVVAYVVGGYNAQLARVVAVDVVASIALVIAAGLDCFSRPS
jgi:hypothetical protein